MCSGHSWQPRGEQRSAPCCTTASRVRPVHGGTSSRTSAGQGPQQHTACPCKQGSNPQLPSTLPTCPHFSGSGHVSSPACQQISQAQCSRAGHTQFLPALAPPRPAACTRKPTFTAWHWQVVQVHEPARPAGGRGACQSLRSGSTKAPCGPGSFLQLRAHAGRWLDQLVLSTGADGVSRVQPSTREQYVSNYLPLWAGLLDDDPPAAAAVLDTFLSSGRPACCWCSCWQGVSAASAAWDSHAQALLTCDAWAHTTPAQVLGTAEPDIGVPADLSGRACLGCLTGKQRLLTHAAAISRSILLPDL